ncbi:MAG: hypothetical protein Q9201_003836 [Fulgogasparrea decipioides]
MSVEDDDDIPELSADTLAVLGDFYSERDENEKRFEDLRTQMELESREDMLSTTYFLENWNMSQFWYSEETATLLAKQLLEGVTADTRIAIVSAPSVFIQIKKLLVRTRVPT